MAIAITIPRLGWNMEEGVFHGWLKKDGDLVRAGESLFTLESEKATEDIECLDSGILRIPPNSPKEGDQVRVGDRIGYLIEPGETPPFEQEPKRSTEKINLADQVLAQASVREVVNSPPTTSLPHHLTTPLATPAISPRARRVADELGVDWTKLQGSGRTGRIREGDVRAAHSSMSSPIVSGRSPQSIPLGSHRRTIAERMRRSLSSTAPVTLMTTVDAVNLVNLRHQFKAAAAIGSATPSYTDFLVKLAAIALKNHPALNARWEEDRILISAEIHVGIAVDTEAGLVVPVVRNVPALSLKELAAKTRDLIERARRRQLRVEEMQGGTFTVSNLGGYGIDAFTPIINLPECAILGVGRIKRQPAVCGDQIEAREQMTLSLTFDHRLVDGAPAARFLQELAKVVENPGPYLMS